MCSRLQRHTIATLAAVVVEGPMGGAHYFLLLDMFLEKYEECAGTFWRGTQLHAKLQTAAAF